MKKIIALAVALVSFGALAHDHEGEHEHKHMVSVSGWENDIQDRSVDLTWASNDKDAEEEVTNYAFNYAYAIAPAWQIGGKFKMYTQELNGNVVGKGDESTTYGVFGIYNFAGRLSNTNYLSVGYDMTETEDSVAVGKNDTETNTWNVEFGHRFSLGHLWSMDFNWSPSIMLSQSSIEDEGAPGTKDDEYDSTVVQLNVLKVDILF